MLFFTSRCSIDVLRQLQLDVLVLNQLEQVPENQEAAPLPLAGPRPRVAEHSKGLTPLT